MVKVRSIESSFLLKLKRRSRQLSIPAIYVPRCLAHVLCCIENTVLCKEKVVFKGKILKMLQQQVHYRPTFLACFIMFLLRYLVGAAGVSGINPQIYVLSLSSTVSQSFICSILKKNCASCLQKMFKTQKSIIIFSISVLTIELTST